jgi:hypothetical protein
MDKRAKDFNMANRGAGPHLGLERRKYQGTGGLSENNGSLGFWPAFMEQSTHCIHLSRTADGQPAPYHCLAGLPESLILARDEQGRVTAVCSDLVSGFVRDGKFYTRAEAAASVERAAKAPARRPPTRAARPVPKPVQQAVAPRISGSWASILLENSLLTMRVGWSMAFLPFNLANSWNTQGKTCPPPATDTVSKKVRRNPPITRRSEQHT